MMRPLKLLTLLFATMLLVSGCTPTYWNSFFKTSEIQGTVATKGKIAWKQFEQPDGSLVYQVTKTPPVLNLSLIPGSSPVDLQNLQVLYYSPLGDEEGYFMIEELFVVMPFMARLQADSASAIPLGQIITNQLVDLTHPERGNDKLEEIDIEAVATFIGRDQLGNSARLRISVPITIEID